MKFVKKLSTVALSAVLLMAVSAGSASAKWGWGDSLNDAVQIYYSGGGTTVTDAWIDSTSDYDFYVIDNRGSSDPVRYSLTLKSPAGKNYDMQLIAVDPNGNIFDTKYAVDDGPGGTELFGSFSCMGGWRTYVKVSSHGTNDYGAEEFYKLSFFKH